MNAFRDILLSFYFTEIVFKLAMLIDLFSRLLIQSFSLPGWKKKDFYLTADFPKLHVTRGRENHLGVNLRNSSFRKIDIDDEFFTSGLSSKFRPYLNRSFCRTFYHSPSKSPLASPCTKGRALFDTMFNDSDWRLFYPCSLVFPPARVNMLSRLLVVFITFVWLVRVIRSDENKRESDRPDDYHSLVGQSRWKGNHLK